MWWNFGEVMKGGKTAIKQKYLFLFPRSPSFIFSLAFFPFSVLHNYYFSLLSRRSLLNLSTFDPAKERNRNLYVMIHTILPSILVDVFRHTFNIYHGSCLHHSLWYSQLSCEHELVPYFMILTFWRYLPYQGLHLESWPFCFKGNLNYMKSYVYPKAALIRVDFWF